MRGNGGRSRKRKEISRGEKELEKRTRREKGERKETDKEGEAKGERARGEG